MKNLKKYINFLFLFYLLIFIFVIFNIYKINLLYNFLKLKILKPKLDIININCNIIKIKDNEKIKKNFSENEIISKFSRNFTGKSIIGLITNKLIILDIDSTENFSFLNNLPNDTVITKTPRGYHYYFYNDTDLSINSYIHLNYYNKQYPIDLFSDQRFIILPPSKINNKDYNWVNNIFDYKIINISDYLWVLKLFSNTPPFLKKIKKNDDIYSGPMNIFNKNCRAIVIWDYYSKSEFLSLINYLNFEDYYNNKELFQILKIKNNFIFLMNTHPKDYNNYIFLIDLLKDTYKRLNVNQILDLSTIGANDKKIGTIYQIKNCIIDWPNQNKIYLKNEFILPLKYFSTKNILISKYFKNFTNFQNELVYGEDSFITIIISNLLKIPNICLGGVSDNNSFYDYENGGGRLAAKNLINEIKKYLLN